MADTALPSSSSSTSASASYSAAAKSVEEENHEIPVKKEDDNQLLRSRTYRNVRSAEGFLSLSLFSHFLFYFIMEYYIVFSFIIMLNAWNVDVYLIRNLSIFHCFSSNQFM